MGKVCIVVFFAIFFNFQNLTAQCPVVNSSNGYSVHINLSNISLVKPIPCPTNSTSYNYNVSFDYNITFSGNNIPGSLWTLQGNTNCNSGTQFFSLPTVGGIGTTTSATATKINSNSTSNLTDCQNSTTASLGCTAFSITVQGPGIEPAQVITCNFIMPVTLSEFNGDFIDSDHSVELNWTTVVEENSSHFEILRSVDGKYFQKIGEVPSQKNSKIKNEYRFKDADFNDAITYYYQLKMVDLDQTFQLSEIINVDIHKKQISKVMATPNPGSNGIFTIRVPEEMANSNETISVYNQNMQLILNQKIYSQTSKVDISNHLNGIYFLKIGKSMTKLIKSD